MSNSKAATAAKKAPPKAIAIGKRVEWVGNRGATKRGRVTGRDIKSNGPWVAVNVADKGKNAIIINVQQSRLRVIG